MEPAAPLAFTTMKSTPVISFAYCANTRAVRSVSPPAPAGMMMDTVEEGFHSDSAIAAPLIISVSTRHRARIRDRVFFM